MPRRYPHTHNHTSGSRHFLDRPSWYADPYYSSYYNPYVTPVLPAPILPPYRPYYIGSYYNYYAPQLGLAPWWAD